MGGTVLTSPGPRLPIRRGNVRQDRHYLAKGLQQDPRGAESIGIRQEEQRPHFLILQQAKQGPGERGAARCPGASFPSAWLQAEAETPRPLQVWQSCSLAQEGQEGCELYLLAALGRAADGAFVHTEVVGAGGGVWQTKGRG